MCNPPIERGLGAYRPLERELDAAVAAARAEGEAVLSFFGKRLHGDWKADDSPVSDADRAADAAIRESIEAAFPDDAVLTEESDERPGKSGRRWIIDPVDGTRSFLRGLPYWCNLIALEAQGEIAVGVVHLPALGVLYRAARGLGAWRGDTRLEIRANGGVSRSSLVLGELDLITAKLGGDTFRRLVHAVGSSASYGAGYGAALVLDGQADAWLEGDVSLWDIAPLGVLFDEAGGCFSDLEGRREWPRRSGLAAEAELHRALLSFIHPTQ